MHLPNWSHGWHFHLHADPLEVEQRQREVRDDFARPGTWRDIVFLWGLVGLGALAIGVFVWVTG
ncbi:MAG: hypothetical protein ACRDHF_09380 [Tepidiformaceae bacterium]